MFSLSKTKNKNYRYISLVAIIILGVASIIGSGGGGEGGVGAPPTITTVSPAQSSDTALVTALVTAQFSIDMDPGSVTDPNNFTIVAANMGAVNASSITYDAGTDLVTFAPDADLTSGEQYIATISSAVQDTSGNNPLARDYVWSFYIAPSLVAVSTDSTGGFVNGDSGDSAINETGEYIVFASLNEFIPGYSPDTNNTQIYRKNTVTGSIELVSITKDKSAIANGPCSSPRISDTGRYVVFVSESNNLDPSIEPQNRDPVGVKHIYLKDMNEGTVTLLDRHPTAIQDRPGNGPSDNPAISGNPLEEPQGIYVVFDSLATDLVTGDEDTGNFKDIFLVHPNSSGKLETTRISLSYKLNVLNNYSADGHSEKPTISDNGTLITFESDATDLVNETNNSHRDIFLTDRSDPINPPTTIRVSLSHDGSNETGPSTNANISADGNFVVFESASDNMVSGDSNNLIDIVLGNLTAVPPTNKLMSVATNGSQATGCVGCIGSTNAVINADGSYVTFESDAPNLVFGDTNGVNDIFVRHTQYQNTIVRVSVDSTGTQGNNPSTQSAISANGNYISFTTPNNFDADDYLTTSDIYRAYNAAIPLTP